jgi:hypothetical protein
MPFFPLTTFTKDKIYSNGNGNQKKNNGKRETFFIRLQSTAWSIAAQKEAKPFAGLCSLFNEESYHSMTCFVFYQKE